MRNRPPKPEARSSTLVSITCAWIAMALSVLRKDPRGSQLWWLGWGPIIGNAFIAAFVGLAVLSARLL